jgi:hypothetical protein
MALGTKTRQTTRSTATSAISFQAYDDPLKNGDLSKDLGSLYIKGHRPDGAHPRRRRAGVGLRFSAGIDGVRQAMDRLENNIEAGDRTIDIVGFSRGAALAISFANEIAKKMPRESIRFIGVWDIVGQFGAPGEHVNAGHDLHFPPRTPRTASTRWPWTRAGCCFPLTASG